MSTIEVADVDGPATHALVVGVGKYSKLEGVRDLTSPVYSAYSMVDWLISNPLRFKSPLSTVTLLTHPLEEFDHPCTEPTFDNVRTAMRQWQERGGTEDCLLLYWCGHGLTSMQDFRRLLLCSDVGTDGSIWDYVVDNRKDRLNARVSKARTQLWLIDACQDAAETLEVPGAQGRGTLPDRNLGEMSADVLKDKDFGLILASAEFTKASGQKNQPSYFCQALQEALNWKAWQVGEDGWVVRTTDLVAPINEYLEELKKPQRCRAQDGIGRHTVLASATPPLIPATFSCRPAIKQSLVRLGLYDIDTNTGEWIALQEQAVPSESPWEVVVEARQFSLRGKDAEERQQFKLISIGPANRNEELPWPH